MQCLRGRRSGIQPLGEVCSSYKRREKRTEERGPGGRRGGIEADRRESEGSVHIIVYLFISFAHEDDKSEEAYDRAQTSLGSFIFSSKATLELLLL